MTPYYDKSMWHDAKNDLPPIGETVIVLAKSSPKDDGSYRISFGYRLARKSRSKSFPTFGKGHWSLRGVVLWCRKGLPNSIGNPELEMELAEVNHVIAILERLTERFSLCTLDTIITNLRMAENEISEKYHKSIKV